MQLIIGMGQTGFSAGRFFQRQGTPFVGADTRGPAAPRDAWLRAFGPDTLYEGDLDAAALDEPVLQDCQGIVLSPGINPADAEIAALLAEARHRGIPVASDIELALRNAPVPYLLITGSNGKSTVTALVADLLNALGYRVAVGGNYGIPALDLLVEPAQVLVLEVSSFQLECCDASAVRPLAATVLNLSPDHLDRHGSIETYAVLKAKVLEHARTAVINLDDPRVAAMADACQGDVLGFSAHPAEARTEAAVRYYLDADGKDLYCDGDRLVAAGDIGLPGAHNRLNVLATLALVEAFAGREALGSRALLDALDAFCGLPHRMQTICSWPVDGGQVRFINDSKATNVGAAVAAIEGLAASGDEALVVIVGGQAKGQAFAPLARALARHADGVVLIGDDAPLIEAALAATRGAPATHRAEDMPQAVVWAADRALALAAGGRRATVLLAPACASFDMFRGYAERGERFARLAESVCERGPVTEGMS